MLPLLFAETPRAGGEGHRFLIPAGSHVSEVMLGEFAHSASLERFGGNYLAVARKVPQVLGSGTIRTGTEILVLIGVDVARLNGVQALSLTGLLDERVSELDGLLSNRSIGETKRCLVIERGELDDWLHDPRLEHIPTTSWSEGPRPVCPDRPTLHPGRPRPRFRTWKAFAVGLMIGFALWLPFTAIRPERTQPMDSGPFSAVPIRRGSSVDSEPDNRPDRSPSSRPVSPELKPGAEQTATKPEAKPFAPGLESLLKSRDPSKLAEFLASWRGELSGRRSLETDLISKVIAFASELNQGLRYDESTRLTVALSGNHDLQPILSQAMREDLEAQKHSAEQGQKSLDEQDRESYERIQRSSMDERLAATWVYLEKAPRQYMAAPVRRYRNWLSKSPSLEIREVIGVETRDGLGSVEIRNRSRTLRIEDIPLGVPLAKDQRPIVLESLVLPGDETTLSFETTVQSKNGLTYSGRLRINREEGPDQSAQLVRRYDVSSTHVVVKYHIPELEEVPPLPPWSRSYESAVPNRRDPQSR